MKMKLDSARIHGFTFVENLVALTITSLCFAAVYALSSQTLYLLNSSSEAVTAEQTLQDRMEQVRNSRWPQVTDSSFIQSGILSLAPSATLNQTVETITISGWPVPASPAHNPTFTVVRQNGVATVQSGGDSASAFNSFDLARVDVTISWSASPGQRSRKLSTSTIWGENSR